MEWSVFWRYYCLFVCCLCQRMQRVRLRRFRIPRQEVCLLLISFRGRLLILFSLFLECWFTRFRLRCITPLTMVSLKRLWNWSRLAKSGISSSIPCLIWSLELARCLEGTTAIGTCSRKGITLSFRGTIMQIVILILKCVIPKVRFLAKIYMVPWLQESIWIVTIRLPFWVQGNRLVRLIRRYSLMRH